MKEFDFERTQLDGFFRFHRVELRPVEQAVLFEFVLHQAHRETAAIDRHV